jgi:hypothetical protein
MASIVTFIKKGLAQINGSFDDPTAPPKDDYFSRLLTEAAEGRCPLYQADVPLSLIRPYDELVGIARSSARTDFIEKVSSEMAKDIQTTEYRPWIHVYPMDSFYVSSDDYCSLVAYEKAKASEVPCLVYGNPSVPGTKNVMGPAPQEEVYKVLGIQKP